MHSFWLVFIIFIWMMLRQGSWKFQRLYWVLPLSTYIVYVKTSLGGRSISFFMLYYLCNFILFFWFLFNCSLSTWRATMIFIGAYIFLILEEFYFFLIDSTPLGCEFNPWKILKIMLLKGLRVLIIFHAFWVKIFFGGGVHHWVIKIKIIWDYFFISVWNDRFFFLWLIFWHFFNLKGFNTQISVINVIGKEIR